MKLIKEYVILLFFQTLLYFVTGNGKTSQIFGPYVAGPRIVGGGHASPGKLPFQVTIQLNDSGVWKHICGGSIIDSEHILTAAHCVVGKSPAHLLILAGVLNNTQESAEETKVVRQVTNVFLHEGYDSETYINDIAIVKVSPSFPTDNPAVKPIPLRPDVLRDGLICTVSGWGKLEYSLNGEHEILQVVNVPFITYDTCRHNYNYTEESIEPGMICAGYPDGRKDACEGDSGGPLQCGGLLTGVVSWGQGCASPNYPGVYADVAYYREWIERQLLESRNHAEQNCDGYYCGDNKTGGRKASSQELSVQVAIRWKVNGEYWCGGSIIDSEHILTTGHCVHGISPLDLEVAAFVLNNTAESSEDTMVLQKVTEIFLHEGFEAMSVNNDIAVLKVSPGLPTENHPSKTNLLQKNVARDGVTCTVSRANFLGNKEKNMPQNLRVATVQFATYEKCLKIYRNHGYITITPGTICAYYFSGGNPVCYGDSGVALQCGGLLTGIVSGGAEGCASPYYPDVYTDVAYHKEWIERQIHKWHKDVDQNVEAGIFGPRIVNGRNAKRNERPFHVAIRWKDNDEPWCGGSIIDNEHVLTAGHCVYGLPAADLVILAGVLNNTLESTEDTKVVREVTDVFVHEEYAEDTLTNDIAILKVSPAFPTDNPAVKPIGLRQDVATGGIKCTVSGWGLLGEKENTTPQILQFGVARLISYEECRSKYSNNPTASIKRGMICADNLRRGQGACYGDGGGPLQCGGLLTGVVSGGGQKCASTEHPDVYTDVAYYKEWIGRQIRRGKYEL